MSKFYFKNQQNYTDWLFFLRLKMIVYADYYSFSVESDVAEIMH